MGNCNGNGVKKISTIPVDTDPSQKEYGPRLFCVPPNPSFLPSFHSFNSSINTKITSGTSTFKVIVVGDTSVGKSSLMQRHCDNIFTDSVVANLGVDYKEKELDLGPNKKVKLQIWDTAGQERFKTITASFYRGSHGALIVYDTSRRDTFTNVARWIKETERFCGEGVQLCLVGNKSDLTDKREVTFEEAQKVADDAGCLFFETSAKTSTNVALCFNALVDRMAQLL